MARVVNSPITHWWTRAPIALILACLALISRCRTASPPPRTPEGIATILSRAAQASTPERDFFWEPSRGLLADLTVGRRVLFLARNAQGGSRDLYRASVRLTPDGRPIEVIRTVNLTSSPLGDVQPLVVSNEYAAYGMVAYGAVQQVTLLNLAGEPPPNGGLAERIMAQLTNWQETDSFLGLGRFEVTMTQPGRSVGLALFAHTLKVAPDEHAEHFLVDAQTGEVVPSPSADHAGATSSGIPHLSKPAIIWAVDTVRTWTGPEPIAWLEERVFALKDAWRRMTYFGMSHPHNELASPVAPITSGSSADSNMPRRAVPSSPTPTELPWPPPALRSIWREPDSDEGKWQPVTHPFLKHLKVSGAKQPAPPYFYSTYVRPDPKRPYAKVLLVAIDSRQLELAMEGGVEDPKPLTGAHGEGRIPRDAATLSRVVGAFNGAFKTTHGQYGMMVNRRVLLPPKPGAASVVVFEDGTTGLGNWPSSDAIPPDIVSYRQNLEPLVDDGRVNPSGRTQWGFQLPGTSVLTHRSGLCLADGGHLVYAWGPEVSATTLGNAMVQAGCLYGIHLDMNPHHTAFAFLDIRDLHRRDFDARILTPEMEVLPERFIIWSPKDFFYLMLRNLEPPKVGGVEVHGDSGIQPSPGWAPAFFEGTVREEGVVVQLLGVAPGRVNYMLPDHTGGELEGGQALAAIGFGNEAKSPNGRSKAGLEVKEYETARLEVDNSSVLRLSTGGSSPGHSGFELPILKSKGRVSPQATMRSSMRRRGAMCVNEDGYVWIALATASQDQAPVLALSRIGCDLIASLDQGAHEPAFLSRASPDNPVLHQHEQAVLYVVGRPMTPQARRWGAAGQTGAPIAGN